MEGMDGELYPSGVGGRVQEGGDSGTYIIISIKKV